MLKRFIVTLRNYLSSSTKKAQSSQLPENKINATRRGFFKKAAVGLGSVTATAGLSKVVVDSVAKPDMKDQYVKDSIAGEQELMDREYVAMSHQEKQEMLQMFISDYKKKS